MLYMLDTDTCSYLIRKRPVSVLTEMDGATQQGHEIVISSITYAELKLGARRAQNTDKLLGLIDDLCDCIHDIYPWDKVAADRFAETQTYLLNKGTPIGPNDTMIAAHAMSCEAVLISNNTRHFKKVPGLTIDNWVS